MLYAVYAVYLFAYLYNLISLKSASNLIQSKSKSNLNRISADRVWNLVTETFSTSPAIIFRQDGAPAFRGHLQSHEVTTLGPDPRGRWRCWKSQEVEILGDRNQKDGMISSNMMA